MKVSGNSLRRQREFTEAAAAELARLQDGLRRAYDIFNGTADPALLEASILEIGALQSRYGALLRELKAMNGERTNGISCTRASGSTRSDRDRSDRTAAEAAEKAYQMGV